MYYHINQINKLKYQVQIDNTIYELGIDEAEVSGKIIPVITWNHDFRLFVGDDMRQVKVIFERILELYDGSS